MDEVTIHYAMKKVKNNTLLEKNWKKHIIVQVTGIKPG